MSRVSKELNELKELFKSDAIIEEKEFIKVLDKNAIFIIDLQEKISYISEKRDIGYVLHAIEDVVILVILALVANCNNFVEIGLFIKRHDKFLMKLLKINSLPSISCVRRCFIHILPEELEEICTNTILNLIYNNEPLYQDNDIIINDMKSMDGKTANSSARENSKNGKVQKMNAMSLFSIKNNMAENTEFIGEKTNEIPTGPILLSKLDIKNTIVLFDALNTQEETINYIVNNSGYYVAPIKGNQGTTMEFIEEYFNDTDLLESAKKEAYYKNVEKRNGYEDIREYVFTDNIDTLYTKEKWNGIKSIGVASRTYHDKTGKKCNDKRYYISNISSNKIELLASAIRNEWSVENKLHYFLDTVFKEDDNKSFVGNIQKNFNILRKFALKVLSIYKQESKLSMNSIRFKLCMDFENEIDKILKKIREL